MRHWFEHNGERGGGDEAGLDAALARREADARGDVGLAGSAGTKGDDILAVGDELSAGETEDKLLVQGREGASKSKLFTAGNFAALMRRSIIRASRSSSSSSISRAR